MLVLIKIAFCNIYIKINPEKACRPKNCSWIMLA